MQVTEQLLRLGRRGPRLRPFCQSTGLKPRGYSRALERALTDFGAEESFARAAARVQEHYGLRIAPSRIRSCTLKHGRAILKAVDQAQLPPAQAIITQVDGSLIPVVQRRSGPGDGRKNKTLLWREVRVCCARPVGKDRSLYGATLGSVETTSWLWRETVQRAGLTERTHVHGVGDGAPWILDKFNENFRSQGEFLLDFYHVSEYLAAAALSIKGEKKAGGWLRCQQGRLLQNQWQKVLRTLDQHLENPSLPSESDPVRNARRYIFERREHLNYAGATQKDYPIGSGEIESAHRHVVQQRLKLPGAWWKESNAQPILNLRSIRANQCWESYWTRN